MLVSSLPSLFYFERINLILVCGSYTPNGVKGPVSSASLEIQSPTLQCLANRGNRHYANQEDQICSHLASRVVWNKGKMAEGGGLVFLSGHAPYPAPFLKKSPRFVGLHLLSLCCGQDVIAVFSVFPRNNMGACLF